MCEEKFDNFRIVKIVNQQFVVVNAGYNEDIKKDDILEVFIPGDEVIDPETKESLGNLDTIIAKLEVKVIYEKMCLCTNAEHEIIKPATAALSEMLSKNYLPYDGGPLDLNVDLTQISGGLELKDKSIKIGSLVRRSYDSKL